MRAHHGVHMYEWWLPENLQRQYEVRALLWKDQSRRRQARPKCGSKCRDGHSCKAKAVVDPKTDEPLNGRCRMHGGLSTGAKTEEGRKRSKKAAKEGMLKYWRKKKAGGTSITNLEG